ncbi:YjjG family noncanonical pyrimidine nucleotidase [Paenibacillus sp. FSL R5-0407]|uniref:YjjG family noncanonical pyrimidine nucleotidase n=1 Tax=Paenibacillus sp. FSL R5-0407 TaxID=2975320 RepID=UPI0030FBAE41
MQYEVILFDLDDTLYDFAKTEDFALRQAFRHFGMEDTEELMGQYRDINRQLWKELEQGLIYLDVLRVERFRRLLELREFSQELDAAEFSQTYVGYLSEASFLMEGSAETCNRLLDAGYRVAVITNGIREVQLGRISRSELSGKFEQVIISEDAGSQKPDPAIFDYAFEKLGHPDKSNVLIVGDSLTSDIYGGNQYGIDTCWFNPKQADNTSEAKPDYEIRSLTELLELLKV